MHHNLVLHLKTMILRGSISIKILNAFKTKLPDSKLKIFDPVVDVKVMKQYCMDCYSIQVN